MLRSVIDVELLTIFGSDTAAAHAICIALAYALLAAVSGQRSTLLSVKSVLVPIPPSAFTCVLRFQELPAHRSASDPRPPRLHVSGAGLALGVGFAWVATLRPSHGVLKWVTPA